MKLLNLIFISPNQTLDAIESLDFDCSMLNAALKCDVLKIKNIYSFYFENILYFLRMYDVVYKCRQ